MIDPQLDQLEDDTFVAQDRNGDGKLSFVEYRWSVSRLPSTFACKDHQQRTAETPPAPPAYFRLPTLL